MKINQKTIRELLQTAKLEKAIKSLLTITEKYDKDLNRQVVLQSAAYHGLQRERPILNDSQISLKTARITYNCGELNNQLKPEWEVGSKVAPTKKKILFLAANPSDTTRMRLPEEAREIKESLKMASNRDDFEFVVELAARVSDFHRLILNEKPTYIHFSGHGTDNGKLIFLDDSGESFTATKEAVGYLFEVFQDRGIECVLLNSCFSLDQATEIGKYVKYVIGMNDKIYDGSAMKFSQAFYDGLGAGEGVPFAYKLGKLAIKFQSRRDGEKPRIIIDGKEA